MRSVGCTIYPGIFVVYLLCSLIFGWTDSIGASRTLEMASLTPVQVGGVSWFTCGTGDWYATKFVARTAKGEIATGAVCEGLLFKGSTVRFD